MVLQVTCESSRGCYSVRNNSKTVDFRKFPRNCLDVGSKAQAISRARLLECLKNHSFDISKYFSEDLL